MPFTQYKKLSVQAAASNSGTWGAGGATGDDLNTGVMGPLDYILAGIASFSLSSSNVSLSFTAGGTGDVSQCMFRFTGTLLANIVVSPAVGDATTYFKGFYLFENLTSGSFSVTVTTAAGSVALPQGRRGVMYVDGTNGPRIVSLVGSGSADPIPAGTVMLFYQNAAPSGWTISAALNDYALKIVSSAGGVTSGSVAYSTLFGRTATDGYTLLEADIPSHRHFGWTNNVAAAASAITASTQAARSLADGTDNRYVMTTDATEATVGRTSPTGGGGSHTHAIDMRVQTASVILATRN